MAKSNAYYKIEDPETLKAIEAFFAKRTAFFDQVGVLCKRYGFESYKCRESVIHGICFYNLSVKADEAEKDGVVDKKKWKTSKSTNGYLSLSPRATAKEHKAEYDELTPKPMSYDELSKLILKDPNSMWLKSYGYKYKVGEYFVFETTLEVTPVCIEILSSEFHNLGSKDEDDIDE